LPKARSSSHRLQLKLDTSAAWKAMPCGHRHQIFKERLSQSQSDSNVELFSSVSCLLAQLLPRPTWVACCGDGVMLLAQASRMFHDPTICVSQCVQVQLRHSGITRQVCVIADDVFQIAFFMFLNFHFFPSEFAGLSVSAEARGPCGFFWEALNSPSSQ